MPTLARFPSPDRHYLAPLLIDLRVYSLGVLYLELNLHFVAIETALLSAHALYACLFRVACDWIQVIYNE